MADRRRRLINRFGFGIQVAFQRTGIRRARRHLAGRDLNRANGSTRLNARRVAGRLITGQEHPLIIDDVAVFILFELTVTAVKYAARVIGQTEETVALNTHIQIAVTHAQYAIAEVLVYRGNLHTHTDLRTGKDVGKSNGARFKSDGLGVSNVVTDDIESL